MEIVINDILATPDDASAEQSVHFSDFEKAGAVIFVDPESTSRIEPHEHVHVHESPAEAKDTGEKKEYTSSTTTCEGT